MIEYKLDEEGILDKIENNQEVFSLEEFTTENLSEIPKLFGTINNLYLEGKDLQCLWLIHKYINKSILNDASIFPSFEDSNITSIFLDYLTKDLETAQIKIALQAIVTCSQSIDVRYIEKFIHLQIIEKIRPLFKKSFDFAAYCILETSLVCKYYNSIEYFQQINLQIPDFFNLIIESHNHNIDILMTSFELFAFILDPNFNEPDVLCILQGIEHLIENLNPPELINCTSLFKYLVVLTTHDNFFHLINQTNLKANIIDLLYRFHDKFTDNCDFTNILFSLIQFFSQYQDCPEIRCDFLIDLIRENQMTSFSPCILYIIGNLFKVQYERPENAVTNRIETNCSQIAIETCLQKNFINDLFQYVQESLKLKIESLTCLSKMITYNNSELRIQIASAFSENIVEFVSILVDSILIDHPDILFDRILAILTIFEDLEKVNSVDQLREFVVQSQMMSLADFEFKDLSDEEDDLINKIKIKLDSLFKEE